MKKFAMFLVMKSNDEKFLDAAIEEGRIAFSEGEIPIGCVIVLDGEIIGCGHNRVEQLCDVSAHAEILAIRDAERKVGNWRLSGATAYITVEPCPMCAAALIFAGIEKIVFGAANKQYGALGTIWQFQNETAFRQHPLVKGGVMADKVEKIMKAFFDKIRSEPKSEPQ